MSIQSTRTASLALPLALMVGVSVVTMGAAAAQTTAQTGRGATETLPDSRALRPPPGQPLAADKAFSVLDANGDGRIDAAEWRERVMALFYLLDDNRDLYLARAEVPRVADDRFREADADGDGRVSAFEFNQAPFTQFEVADKDGDQTVTPDEFSDYVARLREGPRD